MLSSLLQGAGLVSCDKGGVYDLNHVFTDSYSQLPSKEKVHAPILLYTLGGKKANTPWD